MQAVNVVSTSAGAVSRPDPVEEDGHVLAKRREKSITRARSVMQVCIGVIVICFGVAFLMFVSHLGAVDRQARQERIDAWFAECRTVKSDFECKVMYKMLTKDGGRI